MSQKFGFELLEEQAVEMAAQNISINIEIARYRDYAGDSPIEKLFYVALGLLIEFEGGGYGVASIEHVGSGDEAAAWMKQPLLDVFMAPLLIRRQVEIKDVGRVDFLIYAREVKSDNPDNHRWKQLIVECDGHDFHERTKEQAANDRGRDRSAQAAGIPVFRFTGSELWRDPVACAREILDWVWGA